MTLVSNSDHEFVLFISFVDVFQADQTLPMYVSKTSLKIVISYTLMNL